MSTLSSIPTRRTTISAPSQRSLAPFAAADPVSQDPEDFLSTVDQPLVATADGTWLFGRWIVEGCTLEVARIRTDLGPARCGDDGHGGVGNLPHDPVARTRAARGAARGAARHDPLARARRACARGSREVRGQRAGRGPARSGDRRPRRELSRGARDAAAACSDASDDEAERRSRSAQPSPGRRRPTRACSPPRTPRSACAHRSTRPRRLQVPTGRSRRVAGRGRAGWGTGGRRTWSLLVGACGQSRGCRYHHRPPSGPRADGPLVLPRGRPVRPDAPEAGVSGSTAAAASDRCRGTDASPSPG